MSWYRQPNDYMEPRVEQGAAEFPAYGNGVDRGLVPPLHRPPPPPPFGMNPPPPFEDPPVLDFMSDLPRPIGTRTIAHYKRIEQIGEGTYGQVYKAICLATNRVVALKKIRFSNSFAEGLPRNIIREIKILKALQHPNMVEMIEVVSSKGYEDLDEDDERKDRMKSRDRTSDRDVVSSQDPTDDAEISFASKQGSKKNRAVDAREKYKGNLFLVLEYVSHDLAGILDMGYRFSHVQCKCIFRQLLLVLDYMHENKYVHRDLKSSNILIDEKFRIKLADYGLARCIAPPLYDSGNDDRSNQAEFTNKVVTLWYRCPELLLGATRYDEKVDIWSAGCILAELLLGKALFSGKTDMEQLQLIFNLLGTPDERSWEGLSSYVKIRSGEIEIDPKSRPSKLRDKYGGSDSKIPLSALGLIERMLELDPKKRVRAGRALDSQYFLSHPVAPENPADLGTINVGGDSHEFQTKPIRKEAKAAAQKASADAKTLGKDEKDAYDSAYQQFLSNAVEARQMNEPSTMKSKSDVKESSKKGSERSQNMLKSVNSSQSTSISTAYKTEALTTSTSEKVQMDNISKEKLLKDREPSVQKHDTNVTMMELAESLEKDLPGKAQRKSDEHASGKRSRKHDYSDSGKGRESKKPREKHEDKERDNARDSNKHDQDKNSEIPLDSLLSGKGDADRFDSEKNIVDAKEVRRDGDERRNSSDERDIRRHREHKQKKDDKKRHRSRDRGKYNIGDNSPHEKIDDRKKNPPDEVLDKSGEGSEYDLTRKQVSVEDDSHGDKVKRRDRSSERRRDKSRSHKRHKENDDNRERQDRDRSRRYSYDERSDGPDRVTKESSRSMDEGKIVRYELSRDQRENNRGGVVDERDRRRERNDREFPSDPKPRDGRYDDRKNDFAHGPVPGRFSPFHEPVRSMNYGEEERRGTLSSWDDGRRGNFEQDRPPHYNRFSYRDFNDEMDNRKHQRVRYNNSMDDSSIDKHGRNAGHFDDTRYQRDRPFSNDDLAREHHQYGRGKEPRENMGGREYDEDRRQSGHRDSIERRGTSTYDRPYPSHPVDDKWVREQPLTHPNSRRDEPSDRFQSHHYASNSHMDQDHRRDRDSFDRQSNRRSDNVRGEFRKR